MSNSNQNQLKQHNKEVIEALRTAFGNIPVVDAKGDIRLVISKQDIKKAERHDPSCCVFAQSAKRTLASDKVVILKTIAYLCLPDEHGDKRIERFEITSGARQLIEDYDRGKEIKPGTAFVFKKPCKSHTLEGMRKCTDKRKKQNPEKWKEMQKRSAERVRKARLVGTLRERNHTLVMINDDVRTGTGLIKFLKKNPDHECAA